MNKDISTKIEYILMNYLPLNGVSKTRDELTRLFEEEMDKSWYFEGMEMDYRIRGAIDMFIRHKIESMDFLGDFSHSKQRKSYE